MTPPGGLQALMEAGFEEDDARTRMALVEQVTRQHGHAIGHAPVWCWFVPGRVEVFGKHTDYAGGRSVLAAVPRGFAVAASPRGDERVRVVNLSTGETGVTGPEDSAPPSVVGLGYVAAVVRRLALNFPRAALGVDLTLASDLPRASGLSSSSALVVGAAIALIRRGGLEGRPEWRRAIRSAYDLAGYLGAVERGSAFGSLAGTSAVGVFGGSEDHTAILTCRPGVVSACRYAPIQPIGEASMPADWRFVIAASGVEADKAGRAQALYNRASLAADAIVTVWNRGTGRADDTLAGALATSPRAVDQLEDALGRFRLPGFPADLLRRRLQHFLAEDGRVPDAMRAFGSADSAALRGLAAASQADAERLLQNQTEETSTLARLAVDEGAFAASSFGAGFGGSVWALAPRAESERFRERWLAAYGRRYPRLRPAAFAVWPGPGMVEC